MTRIALATSRENPTLDRDGQALLDALARAGVEARIARWDDATEDWAGYDLVAIRSTWDYTWRLDEFLGWVRGVPRLVNPADVVVWNSDKRYLAELEAAGVPTVPTHFVAPGDDVVLPDLGGDEIVVKPAVSASAADTGRFAPDDPRAQGLANAIAASGRTVMVQPYLAGVDREGEASLVYLDGDYSHAARKEPILLPTGGRAAAAHDPAVVALEPTTQQRAAADATVAALAAKFGRAPLYSRIDLIPGADGPVLLEAELIEPCLWLGLPGAADRYVAALLRTIGA